MGLPDYKAEETGSVEVVEKSKVESEKVEAV